MSSSQTFYDVAMNRLDEQSGNVDALDAKVATAFGFAAASLPLFGALLAIAQKDRPESAVVLYVVAIVVYVVMLGFLSAAYRVRDWSFRPDLPTLKAYAETLDEDALRGWVANECVLSIEANEPRLHQKAFRVKAALALVALEALVLTVAALLSLV